VEDENEDWRRRVVAFRMLPEIVLGRGFFSRRLKNRFPRISATTTDPGRGSAVAVWRLFPDSLFAAAAADQR